MKKIIKNKDDMKSSISIPEHRSSFDQVKFHKISQEIPVEQLIIEEMRKEEEAKRE